MNGNGNLCKCGEHEGIGYFADGAALTPGDRAARYLRLREVLSSYYTPEMAKYIESFESKHGKVSYTMQERGKGSGDKEGGLPRTMPVMSPVYDGDAGSSSAKYSYNWKS